MAPVQHFTSHTPSTRDYIMPDRDWAVKEFEHHICDVMISIWVIFSDLSAIGLSQNNYRFILSGDRIYEKYRGGGGGGYLVSIMPVCVCPKVKEMGSFSVSSE